MPNEPVLTHLLGEPYASYERTSIKGSSNMSKCFGLMVTYKKDRKQSRVEKEGEG